MNDSARATNGTSPSFLVNVLSPRQKVWFSGLVLLWALAAALFLISWLNTHLASGWVGALLNILVLYWIILFPGHKYFFSFRMKRLNPRLSIPEGWRVAMVVTKTPSESFSLVTETLSAMLAQSYPHDTWLADEDPSPEMLKWCEDHQVKVSTRKGVAAYHRPAWPRRTKCKEGNLAYFYDRVGYDRYDFVCQLDADHRPAEGYLEEMLRPFVDPGVGYVSAPSICSRNAGQSWVVRARLYGESTVHGPIQAGYSAGLAPFCIGSHYAVRTCALKQCGGLGPELAEDFSTTLNMNAHGWKGVHALDAAADGYGPSHFLDGMRQEFQWVRSIVTLMFTLTPKILDKLPLKLKFHFLFSQFGYLLWGMVPFVSSSVSVVVVLNWPSWREENYVQLLLRLAAAILSQLLIFAWVRRNGWLRPKTVKFLSWEIVAFHLARFPWFFLGSITALIDVLRRSQAEFKVTPKEYDEEGSLT